MIWILKLSHTHSKNGISVGMFCFEGCCCCCVCCYSYVVGVFFRTSITLTWLFEEILQLQRRLKFKDRHAISNRGSPCIINNITPYGEQLSYLCISNILACLVEENVSQWQVHNAYTWGSLEYTSENHLSRKVFLLDS